MVVKVFQNSNFSYFLGIKSEINQYRNECISSLVTIASFKWILSHSIICSVIRSITIWSTKYIDVLLKYIHERITYDETLRIWKDPDEMEPLTFSNWLIGNPTEIDNSSVRAIPRAIPLNLTDKNERRHAILYFDGKWIAVDDQSTSKMSASQRYVVCEILWTELNHTALIFVVCCVWLKRCLLIFQDVKMTSYKTNCIDHCTNSNYFGLLWHLQSLPTRLSGFQSFWHMGCHIDRARSYSHWFKSFGNSHLNNYNFLNKNSELREIFETFNNETTLSSSLAAFK